MVFGGGGGGGRGPKTPFGLSSGTLVTIGFALLVIFAPGVVFGAFNTLFLVRFFVCYSYDTAAAAACCCCTFASNANFQREHLLLVELV